MRGDHADVTHSNNGRAGGSRGRLAGREATVLAFYLVSVINASLSSSEYGDALLISVLP